MPDSKTAPSDFLTRRMRLKEALQLYLEVWILDANGATNGNGQKSLELLKRFPPFDQRQAFIAPFIHQEHLSSLFSPAYFCRAWRGLGVI